MIRTVFSPQDPEQFEKEVKGALPDLRRLDADAVERCFRLGPMAADFPPGLVDEQYTFAGQSGFNDEQELKQRNFADGESSS